MLLEQGQHESANYYEIYLPAARSSSQSILAAAAVVSWSAIASSIMMGWVAGMQRQKP